MTKVYFYSTNVNGRVQWNYTFVNKSNPSHGWQSITSNESPEEFGKNQFDNECEFIAVDIIDPEFKPDGNIYHVPGKNILYSVDAKVGPVFSCDGGKIWQFTYRGLEEFKKMWPELTLKITDSQ